MTTPTSVSPLFSCAPLSQPTLTHRENRFFEELIALPLSQIRIEGKALGQKIFTQLKTEVDDSSEAGFALQKIWEALHFSPTRHALSRKDLFEKAWAGIGDDRWRWQEV